jgi:hypothetical protein
MITEEQIELITQLKSNEVKRVKWLDTVPIEINESYISNPIVDTLYSDYNLFLRTIFGILYDDIQWFLYEWNADKNSVFWLRAGYEGRESDIEIQINCEEDYYQYLREYC